MHYLRKTASASAVLGVNTNASGTKFEATSSTTESGNESDAETVYLNWEECSTRIYQRFADPHTSYQHVKPELVGLSGLFTTSA
ncbi:hypothetical protein MAM1_0820d11276 [Mucor ambiguus]|uniref:Uncharacterized protein n=1 Tax=Mucor ambiguus TaxID=91626 RepID=A0A0C9LZ69_9FUNG|nr:hypothetical protein MAM1_0820d11276 [Mucor ambiguus]